jgi:hypothetical protein
MHHLPNTTDTDPDTNTETHTHTHTHAYTHKMQTLERWNCQGKARAPVTATKYMPITASIGSTCINCNMNSSLSSNS